MITGGDYTMGRVTPIHFLIISVKTTPILVFDLLKNTVDFSLYIFQDHYVEEIKKIVILRIVAFHT